MRRTVFFLATAVALISCSGVNDDPDSNLKSEVTISGSSSDFQSLKNGGATDAGDPFTLTDITIEGDSVFITVSYSGGCKKHSFEVIWNEELTDTDPPSTSLIIVHDANDDHCEAYITETLSFDFDDLSLLISFDTVCVNILNAISIPDSLSVGGWDPDDTTGIDDDLYKIVFTEGLECTVEVTAKRVICGAGLYNNLWFALKDSVNAGIEGYYFNKYLQPVEIVSDLKSFVPVEGKKYILGASIKLINPYNDAITCLAFSGPSVPVKINCITEKR